MPMRTHKQRPHVIATRIAKTTGQSSGSQTVALKWKPHIIIGYAISGSGVCTRFICGENGGGTMRYTTVGMNSTTTGYGASNISCTNTTPVGWSATVAFNSRGYTITWTKGGAGLNATFEFIAVRAKKCWYKQITNPGAAGTVNYTGAGFDPTVVFAFSWRGGVDPSTGWGWRITNYEADCTTYRTGDDNLEASHSWVTFRSGSTTGWWGGLEAIADGISCNWGKTGAGGAVTADCWALDFGDVDGVRYLGDPVDNTDVLSGLDFTPVHVHSGSRHNNDGNSGGIHTENGQICMTRWNWNLFQASSDSDARRPGSAAGTYFAVDYNLSYGVANESVAAVGAPSGTSPYNSVLALGANSRLGGVS